MIDLGTFGYSLVISAVLGLLLGAVFKHAFKFLALGAIVVVIMIGVGVIPLTFLGSTTTLFANEVSAFSKDPYLFSASDGIMVIIAMIPAIKWL